MRSRIQIDSYLENGMSVHAVWMVAQRDAWPVSYTHLTLPTKA